MPLSFAEKVLFEGFDSIPFLPTLVKIIITCTVLYFIKSYFAGASNVSERVLHGKVAIITGGTSGIGAAVARSLAQRGAQLVLLTRYPLSDPFLIDYVEDLRNSTSNELITVEQVDLAELHSIRKFATQWIDNTPPRRLDFLILCGDEYTPKGATTFMSKDMVDRTLAVNYLANFHLISILSPAIRSQPPDRDVRILVGMCSSYLGGDLSMFLSERDIMSGTSDTPPTKRLSSSSTYSTSKLALLTFCSALQKHLYAEPSRDGLPATRRVMSIDPGWTRTPGMRRYITGGSLLGLLLYVITYPVWWFILKSPEQGAQSFLWAIMESQLLRGDPPPTTLIKECRITTVGRTEVTSEKIQKSLWEETEKMIKVLEKRSALKRNSEKTSGKTKK